jgi:hypothetical protein
VLVNLRTVKEESQDPSQQECPVVQQEFLSVSSVEPVQGECNHPLEAVVPLAGSPARDNETAISGEFTAPSPAKDPVAWKSSVKVLQEIKKVGVAVRLVLLGMNFDSECSWTRLPPELIQLILGLGLSPLLLFLTPSSPTKSDRHPAIFYYRWEKNCGDV